MQADTTASIAQEVLPVLLDQAPGALRASAQADLFSDADVHGIYRAGVTFLASGNFENAKALLAVACGFRPQQATYWRVLGYVQRELGQFNKALFAYRTCMLLDPGNTDIVVELADCYLRSGDRLTAQTLLLLAIQAYERSGESGRMPDRARALSALMTVH